jgi:hypothetical protein
MNINRLVAILQVWQAKGHGNTEIDFHDTCANVEGYSEGHENRGVAIDHLDISPEGTLRIFEEGAPDTW